MTRPAPAAAWGIALLLVAPLFVALAEQAIEANGSGSWATEPVVSRRIADFFAAPRPPGTRRGVMLGISGGWCVFEGAPAGGPTQVLPLAAIGQGLHELYPYIDEVLAKQPDFILLQGTALLTASAPPTPYRVARRRLRRRFLWPLLQRTEDFRDGVVAGTAGDICRRLAMPRERWAEDVRSDLQWVTRDAGQQAHRQLITVLNTLIDSGVPVVVFEQPRNGYSAPYFDIIDPRIDAVLAELGDRRRRLALLRYTEAAPDALFSEAMHLNAEGAAVFRRRLLDDLAGLLPDAERGQ